MKIAIYGLTITSSWGNGHATTFRSLCKALHCRGHLIEFVEKDVEWYASNRDMPHPSFCNVHLYKDWASEATALLSLSLGADVIVVASFFPDAIDLTRRLLEFSRSPILFYDIDTPITVAGLRENDRTEYLEAELIPEYAAYLSFTGGPMLQEFATRYKVNHPSAFYCSVDPDMYQPKALASRFQADLSYLGTYAADRQGSLGELLDRTARLRPEMNFLVAGPQYPDDLEWSPNVRRITHVAPPQHPAFYSSARFTLNLTRSEMIIAGWSPSVRLFEASACGAVILSDYWAGLEAFFTPGEEILLPADAVDTSEILCNLSDKERSLLGARARTRVLDEHTSDHRAKQFEEIVSRCT